MSDKNKIEFTKEYHDALSLMFSYLMTTGQLEIVKGALKKKGLNQAFIDFVHEMGEIAHDPANDWCSDPNCLRPNPKKLTETKRIEGKK